MPKAPRALHVADQTSPRREWLAVHSTADLVNFHKLGVITDPRVLTVACVVFARDYIMARPGKQAVQSMMEQLFPLVQVEPLCSNVLNEWFAAINKYLLERKGTKSVTFAADLSMFVKNTAVGFLSKYGCLANGIQGSIRVGQLVEATADR